MSPNCRVEFEPQQATAPTSEMGIAQVCERPAPIAAIPPCRLVSGTGVLELIRDASAPNWPSLLSPQQTAELSFYCAQVCLYPADIAIALDRPETVTGTELLWVVPLPSRPSIFSPQHCMVPSLSIAQACRSPVSIAIAEVSPNTGDGTVLSVLEPLPNLPLAFEPQHLTEPLLSRAQVKLLPAETAVACGAITAPPVAPAPPVALPPTA